MKIFGKYLFGGPEPPKVKKTWVASVPAIFTGTKKDSMFRFYFQLYEDENGKRSYNVTGVWPDYALPETHARYSEVIVPWLKTEGTDQYNSWIWVTCHSYNDDYWVNYPEITSQQRHVDKENAAPTKTPQKETKPHDFKLLKFEKKEETTETNTDEAS